MREINIVFMKEMKRIFSDAKLVFSLFILPVLLIVGIYGLVAVLITNVAEEQDEHIATVGVYQMPESFQEFLAIQDWTDECEMTELTDIQALADAKNDILNKELDVIIAFDEGFDVSVSDYSVGDILPNVQTYYNPSSDFSDNARRMVLSSMLEPYRQSLLSVRYGSQDAAKVFQIDASEEGSVIQDEDRANGELFGTIIPYLVSVLLFAGAMSIGCDMIAGEKERGTMAALLITPAKRTNIVMGKILAMMALTAISAIIYVASMVIALPLLLFSVMGSDGGAEMVQDVVEQTGQTTDLMGMTLHFQPWQILMLILILIAVVFVYVALIAIVAVLAKDMKEASTYITPIYTIVMVSGMVTMFAGENAGTSTYCIPLYGAVIAMKNILGQNITAFNCGVTLLSHLLLGVVIILITAKAFSNEKLMFNA